MAPWQVCVPLGQLASVVQAVPPEEIGPQGMPPVIEPSELLSTHAVRPPAFEYSKLPLLWANALGAPTAAIKPVPAKRPTIPFMISSHL